MADSERTATLYMTIGAPASGKTTFVSWEVVGKGIVDPVDILCPDADLFEGEEYQWSEKGVAWAWRRTREAFERITSAKRDMVIDATFTTRESRAPFIRNAQDRDYQVVAIYFNVPRETLVDRNSQRLPESKRVSEEVMDKFLGQLEAPEEAEGFVRIMLVDSTGRTDQPLA